MAKIKFMTDSSADIPAGLLEGSGIQVLHFPIIVDDREYYDGQDFTPQEFYQVLAGAKSIPTHAQLTPFFFTEQYAQAFAEGYDEVIYTSINAKGSATHQNAVQAIDLFYDEHPEAREKLHITVIDSKAYTMAYGYIVLEAARAAEQGASAAEAAAMIRDWLAHVRILFTPYDLKYAKKSGRVSAAAAVLGDALGIHPIMSFPDGDSKVLAKVRGDKALIPAMLKKSGRVSAAAAVLGDALGIHPIMSFPDGDSKVLAKVRGDKALIPAMLKIARKERKPGTPYLHIKGSYETWNEEMAAACTEALGDAPVLSYYIGGTISINAGPNVTGLIYYKD